MAVRKGPLGDDMPLVSVGKTRLSMLERLRDRLCQQIDVCGDERSLVLLATRLESVLESIDQLLPYNSEECAADQIAARRRARRRGRPA